MRKQKTDGSRNDDFETGKRHISALSDIKRKRDALILHVAGQYFATGRLKVFNFDSVLL